METFMKRSFTFIKWVLAALGLFLVLFCAQRILMPKYIDEALEGRLVAEYYAEEFKHHDVIMIGDCEIYENFSPITLWEQYGIASYLRGSPQQLIWQSYYLLEDTLRYETPEIVVFNVLSMKYGTPQNEAYNRLTLDGMRLSQSKWNAVNASLTEGESMITYLFPLLRFHSRWSELSVNDFLYAFQNTPALSHNGYLLRADVSPLETVPTGQMLSDDRLPQISYEYLDRMLKLCQDNGIELVLVKAPTVWPYWYEEWDEQITEYANERNLLYVNFLDRTEEIGIDFQTDTYDAGLHLNVYGAEKLSSYFGRILKERFKLPDRRSNAEYSSIWSEKTERYEQEKAAQEEEFSRTGNIEKFQSYNSQ